MAVSTYTYWYDGQQRRFLEQVVRAFSGLQYMTGWSNGQPPQLLTVPCTMAQTNLQAASILNNNSENTLTSAPRITVWQSELEVRNEDVQSLSHIDTRVAVERAFDSVLGRYTGEVGVEYQVERLMPRPATMRIQVDIWTSNNDQKAQLVEQIYAIFFPTIEIQNGTNALDWTAKTHMKMDSVSLTSRTIPVGASSEIDITSFRFSIPMWLTVPARVYEQRLIDSVRVNVQGGDESDIESVVNNVGIPGSAPLSKIVTTPGDHWIGVEGGEIILLNAKGAAVDNSSALVWSQLIATYGVLKPASSKLVLSLGQDIDHPTAVIYGTIQLNSNDPQRLFWQIDPDTLPANSLQPITGVIDPLKNIPGQGQVPSPASGQRYLLLSDIANSPTNWGSLVAKANDIIEYRNSAWVVSFVAAQSPDIEYVKNLITGNQLRWTGHDWEKAIDGEYSPGFWRLEL